MDKYQAFRVFIGVAEKLSFSHAAESLRLPKATVSTTIQELESSLGVRLLARTTRQVSLTPEGLNFLERCKQILHDLEDAEAMFRVEPAQLKGKIRVDMSIAAAQVLVIPFLPKFLAQYPEIEIELSTTDHWSDLMREGIDCVIRGEGPSEAEFIQKKLGEVVSVSCASPAYLAKYGKPKNIDDLKNHRLIHFTQSFGSKLHGFEYFDGEKYRELKMKSALTVNSTMSYIASCEVGLGIAQIPLIGVREKIKNGELVEILAKHRPEPYPLNLIYHERRLLTKRVRVFMNWLEGIATEVLTA